jgi:hypothetical protein
MGQQFVVQLPNRPGELAHLARALCARGVNIVQVHQTTVGNLTTAEIYTNCCDDDTTDVLRSMGYPFVAGTSLIVEIEDNPCALGDVTTKLARAKVNVKGCCVVDRANGTATWALSVDKEDVAREILGLPAVGSLTEAASKS